MLLNDETNWQFPTICMTIRKSPELCAFGLPIRKGQFFTSVTISMVSRLNESKLQRIQLLCAYVSDRGDTRNLFRRRISGAFWCDGYYRISRGSFFNLCWRTVLTLHYVKSIIWKTASHGMEYIIILIRFFFSGDFVDWKQHTYSSPSRFVWLYFELLLYIGRLRY